MNQSKTNKAIKLQSQKEELTLEQKPRSNSFSVTKNYFEQQSSNRFLKTSAISFQNKNFGDLKAGTSVSLGENLDIQVRKY